MNPAAAATPDPEPDPSDLLPRPGAGQGQVLRVSRSPASVPAVRQAIVDDLHSRHFPGQTIEEAEVVVSELLTNAIRHAAPLADGKVRVRWKVRGVVVEVEVTDGGAPGSPAPVRRSVLAASGRGLRLVRALAHEWGVAQDEGGVTVWAALGGPSRRRAT